MVSTNTMYLWNVLNFWVMSKTKFSWYRSFFLCYKFLNCSVRQFLLRRISSFRRFCPPLIKQGHHHNDDQAARLPQMMCSVCGRWFGCNCKGGLFDSHFEGVRKLAICQSEIPIVFGIFSYAMKVCFRHVPNLFVFYCDWTEVTKIVLRLYLYSLGIRINRVWRHIDTGFGMFDRSVDYMHMF